MGGRSISEATDIFQSHDEADTERSLVQKFRVFFPTIVREKVIIKHRLNQSLSFRKLVKQHS